jgi:hypothetical protein
MKTTKTISDAQQEIDMMRKLYVDRMNVNQPRRDRMVGGIIILAAVIAVCLLVIAINH